MFRGAHVIVAVLLSMPGAAFAQEKVIVAFGDSTTARRDEDGVVVYATLLERAFAAQGVPVRVVNAGKPSNTTSDGRARLAKDVLAQNPGVVIVQFGINDAAVYVWKDPPDTRPNVSPQDYEKNLRHIVQTLKNRGAEVVLMTPNPCRWTKKMLKFYGKPPYRPNDPDGFNVLLSRYAEIVRQLARKENATLIDVYGEFEAYGRKPGQSVDDLLLDGMHPNAKGHEIIAHLLLAAKPIGDLNRKRHTALMPSNLTSVRDQKESNPTRFVTLERNEL